jgi:glycosyltransferase involved in cell wall biosynthesis
MPATSAPRLCVGILFAQFAAYHVDRCRAVAARLGARAEVFAVEVAASSATYAWETSGEVAGARKLTLFAESRYEEIGRWRRFRAQFAALRKCDAVFVGIGYNELDIIALSLALRLVGVRVFMMSESKFDDVPRRLGRELGKALLLRAYRGAIVGGARHLSYMRLLGFLQRPVLTGYDTVELARIRAASGGSAAPDGVPFADRQFVFVGRFVPKKNLSFLLNAYRRYVTLAGAGARELVLVGGGEQEQPLRSQIDTLGLTDRVEITGFLDSTHVARRLAGGLALLLPSREEQWGLVVNEALAFNLPVIASEAVGARDALVRNLVNGFVLQPDSIEGWAAAMIALTDEVRWRRMVAESARLAPAGDTERFAEAVEALLGQSLMMR